LASFPCGTQPRVETYAIFGLNVPAGKIDTIPRDGK
jgi:hypothetical protein